VDDAMVERAARAGYGHIAMMEGTPADFPTFDEARKEAEKNKIEELRSLVRTILTAALSGVSAPVGVEAWPSGELNRAQTLDILRTHNAWRRGANGPQTDPRLLGLALDAAIAALTPPAAAPRVEVLSESFDGRQSRQHIRVTPSEDNATPAADGEKPEAPGYDDSRLVRG
jgi:hypothetical protein